MKIKDLDLAGVISPPPMLPVVFCRARSPGHSCSIYNAKQNKLKCLSNKAETRAEGEFSCPAVCIKAFLVFYKQRTFLHPYYTILY